MNKKSKVIYSINVDDLQTVAEQKLERELTDEEIKNVEKRLGDNIDWYGAIVSTLNEVIKKIDWNALVKFNSSFSKSR